MKKPPLVLLGLLATIISCENKTQVPVSDYEVTSAFVMNYTPAKTNGELEALTKNSGVKMIRSLKDFDEMTKTNPKLLKNLTEQELSDFRGSLHFNKGGIAGVAFRVIQSKLSKDDYIYLMARLGLDVANGFWPGASLSTSANMRMMVEDYDGYKCSEWSPNTCVKAKDYICTTNCRS